MEFDDLEKMHLDYEARFVCLPSVSSLTGPKWEGSRCVHVRAREPFCHRVWKEAENNKNRCVGKISLRVSVPSFVCGPHFWEPSIFECSGTSPLLHDILREFREEPTCFQEPRIAGPTHPSIPSLPSSHPSHGIQAKAKSSG